MELTRQSRRTERALFASRAALGFDCPVASPRQNLNFRFVGPTVGPMFHGQQLNLSPYKPIVASKWPGRCNA